VRQRNDALRRLYQRMIGRMQDDLKWRPLMVDLYEYVPSIDEKFEEALLIFSKEADRICNGQIEAK
jgi:hypothetical protein